MTVVRRALMLTTVLVGAGPVAADAAEVGPQPLELDGWVVMAAGEPFD